MVELYCDGSARKDGSGWGVAMIENNILIDYWSGQIEDKTNNQMELTALLVAIRKAKDINRSCKIYSDSSYAVRSFNDWIDGWASWDWHKADGKPIENRELMEALYQEKISGVSGILIDRVPGHSGILGNELADALAQNDKKKWEKLLPNIKVMSKEQREFD